jgi:uncharacterized protein YkwD
MGGPWSRSLIGAVLVSLTLAVPARAGAVGLDVDSWPTSAGVVASRAMAAEVRLLELVNADRARHGLPPVELDLDLLDIARERAAAQLTDGPLSHHDPDGELAVVRRLRSLGVRYRLVGENLARFTGPEGSAPVTIEEGFMRSPPHRENILEPAFTRLAVGLARDGSGRAAFAQLFLAVP